jgi:hypothetical protein
MSVPGDQILLSPGRYLSNDTDQSRVSRVNAPAQPKEKKHSRKDLAAPSSRDSIHPARRR